MDAFIKQLTSKQAVEFAKSGIWKDWSSERIVQFQLFQSNLCMDSGAFHSALEDVLGRPVYTHELGSKNYQNIVDEYLEKRPMPTLQEILDLIPLDKRTLILSQ